MTESLFLCRFVFAILYHNRLLLKVIFLAAKNIGGNTYPLKMVNDFWFRRSNGQSFILPVACVVR